MESPRSWSIFKVHSLKLKASIFFYCSVHQDCVVSVSCHTMFGILGGAMVGLPPPPGSATDYGPVLVAAGLTVN